MFFFPDKAYGVDQKQGQLRFKASTMMSSANMGAPEGEVRAFLMMNDGRQIYRWRYLFGASFGQLYGGFPVMNLWEVWDLFLIQRALTPAIFILSELQFPEWRDTHLMRPLFCRRQFQSWHNFSLITVSLSKSLVRPHLFLHLWKEARTRGGRLVHSTWWQVVRVEKFLWVISFASACKRVTTLIIMVKQSSNV